MICILAEDRPWIAGAVAAIENQYPAQTVHLIHCDPPLTERDNYDAKNEMAKQCSGSFTWWSANYTALAEFHGLTAIAGDGSTRDCFADIRDDLIRQAGQE